MKQRSHLDSGSGNSKPSLPGIKPVASSSLYSKGPGLALEERDKIPNLSRLPRCVLPKRYEIKLDIYPEQLSYSGKVNIRVYFYQTTSVIWLHSLRLEILEASLQFHTFQVSQKASRVVEVPEKGCIGIHFADDIPAGQRGWLEIKFCGQITRNLEGFFSTPFVERKTGCARVGAATMFAATEARTCFPCFDEPDLKSVFAIETTVDEDLTVISNMPIMDSRFKNVGKYRKRRRTDYFQWTKSMSTYLVCLVIGQYDYVETTLDNVQSVKPTRIRVYTPCGQRENGRFALQVAKKCLAYFNSYFGKCFPLPKLDLVAVSKLSVGAMENWGLITCRETGLIADLKDANPQNLQKIATLIAHEISHQWFGNLVTMKWWDYLYLNEGFATFMQYLCIDSIYPSMKIFNQFCTDTMVPALGMDALEHSHPIEMPLCDASEISQVFDKITYCKGAAVINMLHRYIGAEKFKVGVQNYMESFSYGNATTEDLWKFFSDSSQMDIGSIMNNWIRELGFPVVKVTYSSNKETPDGDRSAYCGGILNFRQERFNNSSAAAGGVGAGASSVGSRHNNGLWTIPIQGVYMKNGFKLSYFELVLDKEEAQLELDGLDLSDPDCWVKINPGLTGFYRVSYDSDLLKNLFANLCHPCLTSVDRMGLFDDQVAMVLCTADKFDTTGATVRILQLAKRLSQYETSITVWRSVAAVLHQIRTLTWFDEVLADQYDRFCLSIFKPLLTKIGFSDVHVLSSEPATNCPTTKSQSINDGDPPLVARVEPDDSGQCRGLLYYCCAIYGDQEVRDHAKAMFNGHLAGAAPIPCQMRGAIYRAVMTDASQSTFQQLKGLYKSTDSAEERNRILMAFGYSDNLDILAQVLSLSLSEETLAQESIGAMVSVASNRRGHSLAWSFFVNNIDRIVRRYSGGLFLMSRLVKAVTESLTTESAYTEAAGFFGHNEAKLVGAEKAVKQALEHVRLNVTWREKDIDFIKKFVLTDESEEP